jgi:hypothetical protein
MRLPSLPLPGPGPCLYEFILQRELKLQFGGHEWNRFKYQHFFMSRLATVQSHSTIGFVRCKSHCLIGITPLTNDLGIKLIKLDDFK